MLNIQDLKETLPFSYWSLLAQMFLPLGSEPEQLGGHCTMYLHLAGSQQFESMLSPPPPPPASQVAGEE